VKKAIVIALVLAFLLSGLMRTNVVSALALPTVSTPIAGPEVENFFHKQLDKNEYSGKFAPTITNYFGNQKIKWNFCGEMTLLNVLDIMSVQTNGKTSGMKVVDLVNKYFVDKNGKIVPDSPEDTGLVFYDGSGQMTPTSIYNMAETIGNDTGLWTMELVYGVNTNTSIEPVRKSGLEAIVKKANEDVFEKGGVLIMHVGRRSGWNSADGENVPIKWGTFDYFHFITVLSMRMNPDGSARMLIVDSLGSDGKGFVGWVNTEAYTTPGSLEKIPYDSSTFTGIKNIYGVIPKMP